MFFVLLLLQCYQPCPFHHHVPSTAEASEMKSFFLVLFVYLGNKNPSSFSWP